MKLALYLLSLLFFATPAWQSSNREPVAFQGTVTDAGGEPLVGAAVVVYQETRMITAGVTDIDGKFRLTLEAGRYSIEVVYTGYEKKRVDDVVVGAGKPNRLEIKLTAAAALDEVVVTGKPKVERRVLPQRRKKAEVTDTPRRHEDDRKLAAPVENPGTRLNEVVIDGETYEVILPEGDTYEENIVFRKKDGAKETKPSPTAPEGRVTAKSVGETTVPSSGDDVIMHTDDYAPAAGEPAAGSGPSEPAPAAGLLTAGEWNDLHHWGTFWVDQLADGEIDQYQTLYKFYPKNRYTVLIVNENDLPVVDRALELVDARGNVLWQARTDNNGKAELWAALYDNQLPDGKFKVRLTGEKTALGDARPAGHGLNRFRVNAECGAPKNVDIVWAVDATGSMGDEIDYLKTELYDVVARVKNHNRDLAVRMGTVFYRDEGDEYVVRSSPLAADIVGTVQFIRQQDAGGGGDFPEAVHSGLEEAIFRQPWSPDAVARICFLVLDASPHQHPEVIESLQKTVAEAARRGVRIVPVTCSGILKDTEYLMKFFGLATNGTYVFLTDHSGIGGKHLEPTTEEYKVQPFNNLLVRLITEYTSVQTCDGKSVVRFDDPQAQPGQPDGQQAAAGWQVTYYPNPASTVVNLELPDGLQSVVVYNTEGKVVRKLEKPAGGLNSLTVNDLSDGFYTLRFVKNGQVQSGKLLVVKGL